METSVERIFTGDPTLANRYLADQMSEEERVAFEERMVTDPAVLREVELTARFKSGLFELRASWELDGLLQPQRARIRYWAAAAAVAVLAVAMGIWNWGGGGAQPWGAASLQALVEHSRTPLPLGDRHVVARLRSGGLVDAVVTLPSVREAIELRVLPDAGDTGSRYRITLSRAGGSARADIDDVIAGFDGFVSVFVDSQSLEPGIYELQVAVRTGPGTEADAGSFRVEFMAPGRGP